ncbi:MAG: hypothetical protein R2712_22550 [Vicinamibacterales bacterium]
MSWTASAPYDAEPDRLLWFDGATPRPVLAGVVASIVAAGAHGLDPADYDAAGIAEQWAGIRAGGASGPELALFDTAVSVAAARMAVAVHGGRVDPATMMWGYDIGHRQVDIADTLARVRDGAEFEGVLDGLEPAVSHYARAKRTSS